MKSIAISVQDEENYQKDSRATCAHFI